jgi:hypothetical protein
LTPLQDVTIALLLARPRQCLLHTSSSRADGRNMLILSCYATLEFGKTPQQTHAVRASDARP